MPAASCNNSTVTLLTANNPGAVAIIQLIGSGVREMLHSLTSRSHWDVGRLYLCPFDDLDEGLAVILRDDPDDDGIAQIMPHAGPRVVQRIIERLNDLGAVYDPEPAAMAIYPEAATQIEADMLATLARAVSPAAIDLLLGQPEQWRVAMASLHEADSAWNDIAHESQTLDQLIVPPSIVVVGKPNVGKSTLTNQMLGRSVSVVADLPGTTRDWVGGMVNFSGIAVRWLDTPGMRPNSDAIEQQAIVLSRKVIESADIIIALRDPAIDWPVTSSLPRRPDIWCMNKVDQLNDGVSSSGDGSSQSSPLPISAADGRGIDELQAMILNGLGLDAIDTNRPWAFSKTLKGIVNTQDHDALRLYVCDY